MVSLAFTPRLCVKSSVASFNSQSKISSKKSFVNLKSLPCLTVRDFLSRENAFSSFNNVNLCRDSRIRLPLRCSSDAAAAFESPRPQKNTNNMNLRIASARVILLAASVVGFTIQTVKKFFESTSNVFGSPTAEERSIIDEVKTNSRLLVSFAGPLFFAAASNASAGPVNTPLTVVASGMAKWLELYSGVLLVRVLLTWFPNINWERQPMLAIRDMTDPYLNLFRNILPPLYNVLDLSPMLAFMVLGILTSILNASMAA